MARYFYHKSRGASEEPIRKALQELGCVVHQTYRQGDGFPDLVVLPRGQIHLVEVKEGGNGITKAQEKFHSLWPVTILRSVEDTLLWADEVLSKEK